MTAREHGTDDSSAIEPVETVEVLTAETAAEFRRSSLVRLDPDRRLVRVTAPIPPNLSTSAALLEDLAAAGRLAERAIAVSTAATYNSNLSYWEKYCADHGVPPYPPHIEVVAAWVASMAVRKDDGQGNRIVGTGLLPGTISQRLAALAKLCAAHGWPKPTDDPHLAEVVTGCRRTLGVYPRRQVAPVDVEVLRDVLRKIDEPSPVQLRDVVVMLLAQHPDLQAGALCRVGWADVELSDSSASLLLPPFGRHRSRRTVRFEATGGATCAVAALHRWHEACGEATPWLVPHVTASEIQERSVGGRESVHRILRRVRGSVGADGVLDDEALAVACTAALSPTPWDVRDRAMLLTAFFTASRRSNVCRLTFQDMRHDPKRGVRVFFDRTKTDQIGAGTERWLPFSTTPETCPVRAFLAWHAMVCTMLGYDPSRSPHAIPMFCRLSKGGTIDVNAAGIPMALTGDWFADIVQQRVAAAGHDPAMFAGHSMRAGFITAAAEANLRIDQIQQVSGHKSVSVLMGYIRRVDAWKNNPAAQIGL